MRRRGSRAVPDRISTLPDEVICHILSFLSTEQAVATSILSNRWYPLWRSVPVLHLEDDHPLHERDKESHFRFNEFVFSVLLSRDVTQPIKSFTLRCLYDDSNLKKWVSFVSQRGVEYLELECDEPYIHQLPIHVLSCRTLVVLKLLKVGVSGFSSVQLPSLKVLHLSHAEFVEDRSLIELLSGCPVLEDFTADDVSYYRGRNPISSLELKSLSKLIRVEIHEIYFQFPLEAFYNVEYLHIEYVDIFEDKVSPHYNPIPAFYNLTNITLHFLTYCWQWLLEVLEHCPKLQILEISHEPCIYNSRKNDQHWVYPKLVPECLSLHLKECTIRNYQGMKAELRFARYIIQNAEVLQTMRIIYTDYQTLDSNAGLKMEKKLSLCKKRSATCQLFFCR